MRQLWLKTAAIAAVALAMPTMASAALWTTTYRGVVTAGSDGLGTFGLGCFGCIGGGELNGLDFTAVFVTDSSKPGVTSLAGASTLSLSGAGLVSAGLTINGQTLWLGGTSGSQALSDDGSLQTAAHSAGNFFENFYTVDDPDYEFPLHYGFQETAGLSLFVTGIGDGNYNSLPAGMIGFGSLNQYRRSDSGLVGLDSYSDATLLVRTVDMTTDAVAGPVPEPAVWALMIGGFGLAGIALRARTRPAAV